jgi:hypothetical protein
VSTDPPAERQDAENLTADERRALQLEINGRRINEAIERGHEGDATAVFVCECARLGCNERLKLSLRAYEGVRTGFERFLVVPGHELTEIEDVVERHPGYLVVAKRGTAGAVAERSDPRSDDQDDRS